MKDPVIDPEGHTYERSAIEEWLSKNETSPMTRSKLRITDLIPNRALRETIEGATRISSPSSLSPATSASSRSTATVPVVPDGQGIDLRCIAQNDDLWISAVPPASGSRPPVDICCVIDVSGSMCRNATLQNDAGGVEEFDIDLLDVVKHSVKTVINMLEASDRLSLVAFSSNAELCLGLTSMNPAGRKRADVALAAMSPNGTTNLWAGLHLGMETLRKSKTLPGSPQRFKTLILLTDGLPNVAPPRGHIPALQNYLSQHPEFLCSINTFGFGYSLDSTLLSDISRLGNGSYAFIPDSGFVGTIFVNFLANTLSTMSSQLLLSIQPLNGTTLVTPFPGQYPCKTIDGSYILSLGSCQYFQSRDCLVKFTLPEGFDSSLPIANISLEYHPNSAPATVVKTVSLSPASPDVGRLIEIQRVRLSMVDAIRAAMDFNPITRANDECHVDVTQLSQSRELIARYIQSIATALPAGTPFYDGYLKDLTGQVTQALSRDDWYTRWGQHYLPSLICAHLVQQCNNFKDPGVQAYGKGKLFSLLQEEADDVFLKIPPPSRKIESMEAFNNQGGGCFAGDCDLLLANGETKKVKYARKGDRVLTSGGKSAMIQCVVRTLYPAPYSMMCQIPGGLMVTAWHPISLDDGATWTFPGRVVAETKVPCSQVYTFVLDHGHTVNINGVQCVTLGHAFSGDIRSHEYFGSPRVIEDLSLIHGWDDGLINLVPESFCREQIGEKSIITRIIAPGSL